jgi:UDP-N-acetylglucosamine 2-epimerase
MRILTVVGNRPQFVKSAPLSLALRAAGLEEIVVHTGQHYDRTLSGIFFEELGLAPPAHCLDVRSADPGRLQPPLEQVIRRARPNLVLVCGDTNSTVAGARAAAAGRVPIGHVEAGLRSGDGGMPEERNRIEVDRLSAVLFCPDERSVRNLEREGVSGRVVVTGDVMADAARLFLPIARERIGIDRQPGSYLVATLHREANVVGPRLRRIVEGLNRLRDPVVFPAHPRTRSAIAEARIGLEPHIELVEPLGYLELAALASQARVILTDSGGLQKEAYWYGVPCVTMRPSTEWVDTVALGANTLVDDDPEAIVEAVAGARMPAERPVLYGDGHASERVAAALLGTIPCR